MQGLESAQRFSSNSGIIVIDDAWPVTDGLCLAFLDMFTSGQADFRHIDYARTPPLPPGMLEEMDEGGVTFRSIAHRQGMSAEELLNAATSGQDRDGRPLLILQEKSAIRLFYERMADPTFKARVFARFSLLAVDYNLGLEFDGTDILRRAAGGIRRAMISANAKKHLPSDCMDVCDTRIGKADIRIATLAEMLAGTDSDNPA